MIPLRDVNKSKSFPIVNYLLITFCGVIFLFELSLGSDAEAFLLRFGVIPLHVSTVVAERVFIPSAILPLFTSMFLHGGWMHLIGNMLYLYVFGDNVEDKIGHLPYLFFYLLCGIGAALVEVYFNAVSTVPLIGASGAIAGVLGAYFILYPRAKVLTLIPLIIFFPVVELSAFFFLGFWFVMQFIQASFSYGGTLSGGVAWWAHAGGFVVGMLALPVFFLARRF
jgi:membrane associated rhomboid family serine protease